MRNRIKVKNNNLGNTGTATLLWTNPNPLVAFAAQTVSLDLSIYKTIIVIIKNNWISEYGYSREFYKNVKDILFVDGLYYIYRSIEFNNNGVIFGNGYSEGSINNGVAIPLYIYGLK